MQTGPKINLAIDLHRIDKYFPLDYNVEEGFDYNIIIDRFKYDEVATLLKDYRISEDQVIREICFILQWIEKETQAGEERDNRSGKFYQMWNELDNLKAYLMKTRITSISFNGEYGRNKPGDELIIGEDINIDRICDGIRSVFRDEFHHDKHRRKTKGLTAWQKRKMIRIKNNILNYFTSVPRLDDLSLEEQNELITRLEGLAGISL
jgi:hypothetical protein